MVSMKAKFAGGIAAAVMGLAIASASVSAQQAPTVLKLAHGATADNAIGKGMVKFAENVAAKTGGKVKVETYLAG